MSEQLALLPGYLTAHLQLTLLALLAGVVFSVPAGILVTRWRWLDAPVLGLASVIQTIPSLALLAIMVPLLAAAGLRSIGFLPAFIGLSLYSVLPILRNTATGLAGIDPALIEAARGVGMTAGQRLRWVELPLALPVILAGIRTSTVWTVGVATLSTPVGATSLGNYIFGGLQTRNLTAVLVGCVAAAGLALTLDGLVRGLGAAVISRRRGWIVATAGAIAALYLYTGVSTLGGLVGGPAARDRVVIGAKTFTEQYILSEILAAHLERTVGVDVEVLSSLGSTVAFDGLVADELDVYVDYTGTIWATIMGRGDVPEDRGAVQREVARYLRSTDGVELVGALGFENAYALAMRRGQAETLGVRGIGDLAPYAPELEIGGDYEFFSRQEWTEIRDRYGLEFGGQRSMDSSLMYQAVAVGDVDVISAFSTDGRIVALDLAVLDDELGAIPPYDAVILVGPRIQRERPDVVEALRALSGSINATRMRQMNLSVDQDGETPRRVALRFLDGRL